MQLVLCSATHGLTGQHKLVAAVLKLDCRGKELNEKDGTLQRAMGINLGAIVGRLHKPVGTGGDLRGVSGQAAGRLHSG